MPVLLVVAVVVAGVVVCCFEGVVELLRNTHTAHTHTCGGMASIFLFVSLETGMVLVRDGRAPVSGGTAPVFVVFCMRNCFYFLAVTNPVDDARTEESEESMSLGWLSMVRG